MQRLYNIWNNHKTRTFSWLFSQSLKASFSRLDFLPPVTTDLPSLLAIYLKPEKTINFIRTIYYINTNEIPSELWRENFRSSHENNVLSSQVKISPLLWLHNKSREMVWYFIGVYIIKRTLHARLDIRNFSSGVEKIFSTPEEKFHISARPCNILCW